MARKDELIEQCYSLGLEPKKSRKRKDKDTGSVYCESSIKDLEESIQNYYVEQYSSAGTLSPFLDYILQLDSPMLALQLNHVKPDIVEELWKDNNDYIFQEKLDGTRCLVCWSVDYGWDFYSRNKSVKDCLPISYKSKLIFPDLNRDKLMSLGVKSFIIDCELLPYYNNIRPMEDNTEIIADTQLNLVTSILGSLDELSHKMQKTNPLKLIAFDLLMYNNVWLTEATLSTRDHSLDNLLLVIKNFGMFDKIEKVQTAYSNKEQFYNDLVAQGKEGCVCKNKNSTYDKTGKRTNAWVKIKRTVSQSLLMEKIGDTIDAFVTGYKVGNEGTNRENQVSALEFSVFLTDENDEYLFNEDGSPMLHHIATMSGLSDELRSILTTVENGIVVLNPSFYGKVAEIDGQDISSKNYRFAHAIFKGWRPDRDADSCKFRKAFLEKLVL